jgi:hypothetical protein
MIERLVDCLAALDIDARPDDGNARAALNVEDDGPRLSGKAKLFLGPVDPTIIYTAFRSIPTRRSARLLYRGHDTAIAAVNGC